VCVRARAPCRLQMREIMASLGFAKVDDMVGRADMLETDPEVVKSSPKVRVRAQASGAIQPASPPFLSSQLASPAPASRGSSPHLLLTALPLLLLLRAAVRCGPVQAAAAGGQPAPWCHAVLRDKAGARAGWVRAAL